MNAPDEPQKRRPNARRRSVLAAGAAAGLAAVSAGLRLIEWPIESAQAKSDDQPVTANTRWGMLIDTDQCAVGCDACVTACNDEHGLIPSPSPSPSPNKSDRRQTDAQWIRKVTLTDNHTGHITSLPMLCQHCEDPPCVDVCPTGASFKREDGIVLVDKHTCIGCRYCVIACPYKARSFVHENLTEQKSYSPRGKGTVEGCTLCVHRVDKGGTPACVEACNSDGKGAMRFGDLNDPNSEIATRLNATPSEPLRADLGLNPGVRYQNL